MASQKSMINTMMFYHWDETLFNGMSIPAGIDRDLVVSAILEETSDFPIIITDLETLRFSINKWSAHRVDIWEHFLETTRYEYNPIENYDRTEEENTTSTKDDTMTSSTNRTGADTDTESVSAFNASGLTDHTKSTTSYGSGSSGTDTVEATDTFTRTLNVHGNIGVMSSQDMIKQEREIADFDIIDIIVDEYKKKFCILIY